MAELVLAGVALAAVGALLPLRRRLLPAGLLLQALGLLCVGAGGAWAAIGDEAAGHAFTSVISPAFGIDRFSGTMLALVAGVALPAALACISYLRHVARPGAVASLFGCFVLALAGVVTARDPSALLACWELMTLLPAVASLVADASPHVRRAMFEYLAITHIGGAGVWAAVLVLADHGAIGGVPMGPGGATAGFAAAAAIVGFGTKAGLVPLHAWLPRAHPVAPSPLSAVMSGAMVAVALYGLVRVLFQWMAAPSWAGPALMAVGAVTAVTGIVYAAVQQELKLLLAHSTIENMGVAAAALGASLWLHGNGADGPAALAFGAAMLHLLTHAAAKGGLFLAAGAVQGAAHTLDLGRLGGLGGRMPWTGAVLGVAGVSLAGLPPTAGFVSEWAVLQGAFGAARIDDPVAGFVAGGAVLLLGVAAGLAALAVAKMLGLVLLGPPRTDAAAQAQEAPGPMRAAHGLVLAGLAALVLAAGWILPGLAGMAGPATGGGPDLLDVPATGGLTPAWTLAAIAVATLALTRLRGRAAARAPIWLCGQPALARQPYTGAGFTKSFRLAVDGLLRSERDVEVERRGGLVHRVTSSGRVPDLVDRFIYDPAQRVALAAASQARRLQSGSLRAYIAWLGAMVVVCLALLRTGWLS
ncbi:MAG: proton-conducting transporter membrane subunit [Thermoleophilia bacterium]